MLAQQHQSQMEAFSIPLIWLWIKADPFLLMEHASDRRDWGMRWLHPPTVHERTGVPTGPLTSGPLRLDFYSKIKNGDVAHRNNQRLCYVNNKA